MVSARDFKVGELVRFRDDPILRLGRIYSPFLGQLCVVLARSRIVDVDYEMVHVKCLASGAETSAYAHRLDKVPTEEQYDAGG